jgi:predicted DNA-binding transcriptional regulator AlpA
MRKQIVQTKEPPRLINRIELLYRVPISWPTIDKEMLKGTFPTARKVNNKWMWLESDVKAYIAGTWRREKVGAA